MDKVVDRQQGSMEGCIVGPLDEIQIALVLALLGGGVSLLGGTPGRPSGPPRAPAAEPGDATI